MGKIVIVRHLQPSTHHITHVLHTADPIAMGTCNGVLSSCALGGYAMESRYVIAIIYVCIRQQLMHIFLGSCHYGNIIEYDTVTNLSWSVDVRTHAIAQIVDKVLSEPWPAANELGLEVPPSKRQDDCVVSYGVPSRKVELFSHWYGAAAGLLQMGLRKLQLMNRQTFFSGCPYTPLPKASLPHTVGHNKLVLERMFVTDRQATKRNYGMYFTTLLPSSKPSRRLRAKCGPLDIGSLDANLTNLINFKYECQDPDIHFAPPLRRTSTTRHLHRG